MMLSCLRHVQVVVDVERELNGFLGAVGSVVVYGHMSGACLSTVENEIILLLGEVVVAGDHEIRVVGLIGPVKAVRGLAVGIEVSGIAGACGRGALRDEISSLFISR